VFQIIYGFCKGSTYIHFGKDMKDSIPERHRIKKFSNSDFLRFLKEVKWPTSRVSLQDSLFSRNIQRRNKMV